MALFPRHFRAVVAGVSLLGTLLAPLAPVADEPPPPPFTGVRGAVVEDLEPALDSSAPQNPVHLTKARFPSGKDSVAVDLYEPAGGGLHPAVVVIHGTHGPRRGEAYYLNMSEDLARHGYVALFIRYYDRGRKGRGRGNRSQWSKSIGSALDWASTLPSVDPDRMGLVGYSQGAFLSLNYAPQDTRVKVLVAFYGGLSPGFFPAAREHMPPSLLLHGTADRIVPVRRSLETFEWLRDSGKPVDLVVYPTVGHGFTLHERGGWDEVAGADAWDRTLRFLDYQLKSTGWRPETPALAPPPETALPPSALLPLDFAHGFAPPPPDLANPLALPSLMSVPYLREPSSEKGKDFVLVNPVPSEIRALAAKHAPPRRHSARKGSGVRKPTSAKPAAPKAPAPNAPASAKPASPKPAVPQKR